MSASVLRFLADESCDFAVVRAARPTLNRLARWNLHHKEWIRLVLGGGVAVMGLVILATV